eukprot:scaffold272977_cov51-Attheya_sp.AAC.2
MHRQQAFVQLGSSDDECGAGECPRRLFLPVAYQVPTTVPTYYQSMHATVHSLLPNYFLSLLTTSSTICTLADWPPCYHSLYHSVSSWYHAVASIPVPAGVTTRTRCEYNII